LYFADIEYRIMKKIFGQSIYLGNVLGIPIKIHWTFSLLILWIFGSNIYRGASIESALWSVLFVLSLFACVFLHELGHAMAARRYGIRTMSIVLLPIGGVASLEKIPSDPKKEMIVAFAGPAVNAVISLLIGTYYFITGFPELNMESLAQINSGNIFFMIMTANIFLGGFNLIPAFPMDGGRVLRALLSIRMGRVKATRAAVSVASVFAVLFVIYGIYIRNPFMAVIALFIYMGARSEFEAVKTEFFIAGSVVKDVLMRKFTVLDAQSPLKTAIEALLNGQETAFFIKENEVITKILTKTDIIRGLSEKGNESSIGESASEIRFFVHESMPLEDLIDVIRRENVSVVPVKRGEEVIGMVDINNLTEFQLLKAATSHG